jgi:hypothetical protein
MRAPRRRISPPSDISLHPSVRGAPRRRFSPPSFFGGHPTAGVSLHASLWGDWKPSKCSTSENGVRSIQLGRVLHCSDSIRSGYPKPRCLTIFLPYAPLPTFDPEKHAPSLLPGGYYRIRWMLATRRRRLGSSILMGCTSSSSICTRKKKLNASILVKVYECACARGLVDNRRDRGGGKAGRGGWRRRARAEEASH